MKGGDAEDVTVAEVRFRHISAWVLSTWLERGNGHMSIDIPCAFGCPVPLWIDSVLQQMFGRIAHTGPFQIITLSQSLLNAVLVKCE